MTTPKWQSGHLYLPGDLVQPQQVEKPTRSSLVQPSFEAGDLTGWTVTQSGGTGTASVASDKVFAGTYAGRWQGAAGSGHSGGVEATWENDTDAAVVPGQVVSAQMMFALDDTGSSQNQAQVRLHWYNASAALIGTSSGNLIHGNNRSWQQSNVTGSAPAGAATVRLAAWTTANASGGVRLDGAYWNHVNPSSTAGLIYKAVQSGPGTSDDQEPTWPSVLGVQVVDNTVTWEAVNTNRVVWEADPILTSGGTEPNWPTNPGDFVSDGTIKWECVSRRIEDENCPNSKVVAILSSKVFAVDRDIIRFSATANPLDWTSERDAGFLPTGLQQANSNDMSVLAPYRSNLAAFNPSCFQMWQPDPDPEAMAQLDQKDGIGSSWPKAAVAVADDLLFLTKLGVRSVGMAVGSDNLAAGDIGMPIDPLVQAAMVDATKAVATYYPGAGQYWLAFQYDTPEIVVWATTLSGGAGGFKFDSTQTFNSEMAGASSVTVTGYYTPAVSMFNPLASYPPPSDAASVDLSAYTFVPASVALTESAGVFSRTDNGAIPSGRHIATVSIDGGDDVLAFINSAAGV